MQEQRPLMGFYDSHHSFSVFKDIVLDSRSKKFPIVESSCVCTLTDYYAEQSNELPSIVVLNPNYGAQSCITGIAKVVQANPEVDFYIAALSYNTSEIDALRESVGAVSNVTYLYSEDIPNRDDCKPLFETVEGLVSKLK